MGIVGQRGNRTQVFIHSDQFQLGLFAIYLVDAWRSQAVAGAGVAGAGALAQLAGLRGAAVTPRPADAARAVCLRMVGIARSSVLEQTTFCASASEFLDVTCITFDPACFSLSWRTKRKGPGSGQALSSRNCAEFTPPRIRPVARPLTRPPARQARMALRHGRT